MAGVKKIRQAVILAGGMGMRLRPFTYDTPKAIVPVNGRPFLAHLIEMLKGNGIEEVVMLLGYLPEKIQAYLGDGSALGVSVKHHVGGIEDATGTRVRNARHLFDDTILLCYCDNYINLDVGQLVKFHREKKTPMTMTVYSNEYGITKNNAVISDDGYIVKYDKTRMMPGLTGVDIGFFVLEKDAFDLMPEGEFWIDADFLPKLVSLRKLAGYRIDRPYYSLSNPDRLKATAEFLGPKKVIFLDRDGVINEKMPVGEYVRSVKEFKLLPGVKEAMRLLTDRGYEIYIISNQAGIGRGVMRESDLFRIHQYMEAELGKSGVKIAGIYYCPHKVEDHCKCRKPKAGMLYQASIEHRINLSRAIFIGDDLRDMEAGATAGCRTELLTGGRSLLQCVKELLTEKP
jgi:D-glycero-D-manno-heptose 1,7-bisphosphate phosphatase